MEKCPYCKTQIETVAYMSKNKKNMIAFFVKLHGRKEYAMLTNLTPKKLLKIKPSYLQIVANEPTT